MKVQGRLMPAHFIEIYQVFAKKKKLGYISDRVVCQSKCLNELLRDKITFNFIFLFHNPGLAGIKYKECNT